ncbi:MAG TPA: protein phosphatase 2C domain-containing protein [Vicinamibacterales bacterium]|nr:protein phosphatase 2C domain-containing protein [Vicinamibacterales bacterium]
MNTLLAAGATDPGIREVNEDRFHIDEARGLFIVIDGIGGQAAGGRAADIALSMLRQRLERETGPVCERVREAIAIANNEIYRLASTRPEWDGMACVLTVAVVKEGVATIGHVGDTRLYKLHHGGLEKITRDHSPVGEREDAHELSEFEAMRHPRRNEVYRDVGSEPHTPSDPEFVDLQEIPFEPDEALLLCSDGLTDLVDSASILREVRDCAGEPHAVAHALVDAANTAGGRDNVTVVYVEGGTFAAGAASSPPGTNGHLAHRTALDVSRSGERAPVSKEERSSTSRLPRQLGLIGAIIVSLIATGFIVYRTAMPGIPLSLPESLTALRPVNDAKQVVHPGESIAAALSAAKPDSEIIVEPGEYSERLTLTNNIRLVSRVPRGATIRLPATTSDVQPEPAVAMTGPSGSELVGFKIVGDARTPLAVGILVAGSEVSLVDVEVSGAATAAISFAHDASASLVGGEIHDNPGAALAIAAGASARITHSVFSRNGLSQHTPATFAIDKSAAPLFQRNVFVGIRPEAFAMMSDATRLAVTRDNWFH